MRAFLGCDPAILPIIAIARATVTPVFAFSYIDTGVVTAADMRLFGNSNWILTGDMTARQFRDSLARGYRDFSNLYLRSLQLVSCDISGIDFSNTRLSQSSFWRAILTNSTWNNSKFDRLQLDDCDFTGATFINCDFKTAKVRNCNFTNARFVGCDLSTVNFRLSTWTNASFENCPGSPDIYDRISDYCDRTIAVADNGIDFIDGFLRDYTFYRRFI